MRSRLDMDIEKYVVRYDLGTIKNPIRNLSAVPTVGKQPPRSGSSRLAVYPRALRRYDGSGQPTGSRLPPTEPLG